MYRTSFVGRLMWSSVMTRPDIANALRACARHSHKSSPRHWEALLQLAAYVNATKEIGLRVVRGSGLRLCTQMLITWERLTIEGPCQV